MLTKFIVSRRQGLSSRTIEFYEQFLGKAFNTLSMPVTGEAIREFINSLTCSNSGKHGYFRALRAFFNWLYSPKSGMGLDAQDNPIMIVEAPKIEYKILPSLTPEQIDFLLENADCVRDKAIISLFADSGLRLAEMASIRILTSHVL